MMELPEQHRLAGFRSEELPVALMLLRWKVLDLEPPHETKDPEFAKWRELIATLPAEKRVRTNVQLW